ncbi:hypothetical protein GN330_22640 [Nitratireductor sp. CAU 1489]|uniref:Uncharacterized protein n=1 Tax=Nitratireductor arenosus TaxID=2682096 RepID=A0A844QK99_9HYPH|nr:hypothetical protein [Nitratireductor arenosus]MVB00053.1 hypothetical protein [Nitratireductor arenosus]
MSALLVIQDAVEQLPITNIPSTIEGTDDPDVVSLRAALNMTGRALVARHNWNTLGKSFAFIATGGTPQQEALPDDWRTSFSNASVWRSGSSFSPLSGPCAPDAWHRLLTVPGAGFPGYWRQFGGNLEILGVASGETLSVQYVSKGWVVPISGGVNKERVSKDDDAFAFPEYLLTLGTVYNWLSMKNLPYAQEMADFEHQLELDISADRAARPVNTSWPVDPMVASRTWPGIITP